MKRLVGAFVLVIAVSAGGAPPAEAQVRACANHGEYGQVHRGMAIRRVHQTFDTRGRRTAFARHGRFTSQVRRYRGCPRDSAVSVAYVNGRLRSKSASWD